MKRIDGLTPAGGDYSEIWYFDDNGNVVNKSEATTFIVRECMKDGTLISSTRGFINNGN
mgnify:CR=1 FL=1